MAQFSLLILLSLLGACALMMSLELLKVPLTLSLKMKGDLKRDTRWLAQFGQTACTFVAAMLVLQMDRVAAFNRALLIGATVSSAAICVFVLKRLLSRVRPGRENAGKFLGPHLRHANWRESFPSSHSACAASLATLLTIYYPQAAATLYSLAGVCAVLRYLLDAHWPSDVLAGLAVGYAVAHTAGYLAGAAG